MPGCQLRSLGLEQVPLPAGLHLIELYKVKHCFKEAILGAGEMTKWLKALAALLESRSSIPGTHFGWLT